MPLLTVRLSEDEYAALKGLAGTGTMASLIKAWISAGGGAYTVADAIGKTPVSKPLDVSGRSKPGFMVAKDEDCGNCGHDLHSYHLEGRCTCPIGPRQRCGCMTYISAAEPF